MRLVVIITAMACLVSASAVPSLITCPTDADEGQFLDIPRFLFSGQSNMIGSPRQAKAELFDEVLDVLESVGTKQEKIDKMIEHVMEAEVSTLYSSANEAKILYKLRRFLTKEKILNPTEENALCSFTDPSLTDEMDCEKSVTPTACGYQGDVGEFGPELVFAHRFPKLNTEYKGKQVGIIKVAVGGTEIQKNWSKENSGSPEDDNTAPCDKNYWQALADAIEASNGTIKGFVWFQGENDSFDEANYVNYQEHLTTFIANVREEIFKSSTAFQNASDIPVVIVELGAWIYEINTAVIDAQRAFVRR